MEVKVKKIGLLVLILSLFLCIVPQTAMAAETTSYEQELTDYLSKISNARGFDVTKDDLIKTLTYYNLTLDDFQSADEIDQFLGEVIAPDYSNLSSIYERYNLDQASLTELLNEYGENLDDYIYIYDLYRAVNFYTNYNKTIDQPELTTQMLSSLMDMMSQLGLTDKEIQNIEDHFVNLTDELSSADTQIRLKNLSNRLMEFASKIAESSSLDENYKPSDSEINEYLSLYNDLLSILKLNIVFSLSNNGTLTPISITELINMEDVGDSDIKIEVFDSNSVLLADLVVSGEMLGSELDNIIDDNDNSVVDNKDTNGVQTIKGGKLPKTAGNYIPNAFYGLFTAFFGFLIYRKVRNA